jgi:hypothetical protein
MQPPVFMHWALVLKRGFWEHLPEYQPSLARQRFARVPGGETSLFTRALLFERLGKNIRRV